ncbi:MAG: nucleoside diphosphate kinase regulator [Rhizorhabdus sp.]
MTETITQAPPPIHMIDSEADALTALAIAARDRQRQVSDLLLSEIDRAIIHRPGDIPADAVTMNARVAFSDAASGGVPRTVQLVYPGQADIALDRISILTPVGAGLIGLRQGQSILWPDREGRERRLTIVSVKA